MFFSIVQIQAEVHRLTESLHPGLREYLRTQFENIPAAHTGRRFHLDWLLPVGRALLRAGLTSEIAIELLLKVAALPHHNRRVTRYEVERSITDWVAKKHASACTPHAGPNCDGLGEVNAPKGKGQGANCRTLEWRSTRVAEIVREESKKANLATRSPYDASGLTVRAILLQLFGNGARVATTGRTSSYGRTYHVGTKSDFVESAAFVCANRLLPKVNRRRNANVVLQHIVVEFDFDPGGGWSKGRFCEADGVRGYFADWN